MKTQLNQILTITAFFTLAISSTLAVSWGVSDILRDEKACETSPLKTVIIKQVQEKLDLNQSFKLLIPKLK
jgi:hypothetical protein